MRGIPRVPHYVVAVEAASPPASTCWARHLGIPANDRVAVLLERVDVVVPSVELGLPALELRARRARADIHSSPQIVTDTPLEGVSPGSSPE